jgi:hypothetical protein
MSLAESLIVRLVDADVRNLQTPDADYHKKRVQERAKKAERDIDDHVARLGIEK